MAQRFLEINIDQIHPISSHLVVRVQLAYLQLLLSLEVRSHQEQLYWYPSMLQSEKSGSKKIMPLSTAYH